jgi:hypothetical protein
MMRRGPFDQGLEEDLTMFGNSKRAKLIRARTPIGAAKRHLELGRRSHLGMTRELGEVLRKITAQLCG